MEHACGLAVAHGFAALPTRAQKSSSLKENASPDKLATIQENQQTCHPTSAIPRRDRHFQLPQRYKAKDLIGSGTFGSVREGYDREKQRRVAIKRTPHVFADLHESSGILRDVMILSRLEHDSIVDVSDIFNQKGADGFDELYIVMEVCDTDMKRLLHTNVSLDRLHINTMLYNLLLGLSYLHSAGICHMDLRPANCLMNQDCSVKIRDFSVAGVVGEEIPEAPALTASHSQRSKRHSTSRSYQAPELMLPHAKYSEAVDAWSLGCIYAELLQMLPGIDVADRRPLFRKQGPSMSSSQQQHQQHGGAHAQSRLGMIFQLLGTPAKTDLDTLASEDVKKCLRAFPECDGEGLHSRLPHADEGSLELVGRLLKFLPEQRMTMAEALAQRLFVNIRNETREVRTTERVKLPYAMGQELDEPLLRKQFGKVLQMYHPSCL
jgi:mitogen-activated protein kinase 1/3